MNKKELINLEEINNYKEFAFREDILKMSMAFILGASVNKVAHSIGQNLISPIVNFLLIRPNSIWSNFSINLGNNIKIEVGSFLSVFFEFLITSVLLYVIYIKLLSKVIKTTKDTKNCKFCMSEINKNAKRCPKCTSKLLNSMQTTKKKNL